jgi:Outer membrane protein beta-barrel domain
MKFRALSLVLVLLALFMFSSTAQAVHVTAGWTDSDIGLTERGNGFYVGVLEHWPMSGDWFEFSAAAEYVQKSGSMMRLYADPEAGPTEGKATATLHCLQPAAFVGVKIPGMSFLPRFYTGVSLALKLSESWDEPQGETIGDYGYEQMDLQAHLGISAGYSRFLVDARYNFGLTEQLIEPSSIISPANKALDQEFPENGAKINSFQLGLGFAF